MENNRSISQKKRLFTVILSLIFLCILIIGTKIAVEQSVKNQLVLVGEQLTGRKFETDSVTYHPLFFDLVITGLKMKNPPGYSLENPAMEIKKIHVRIAPWAILSHLVHIRKLDIKGVSLYPEIMLTVDKKIIFTEVMFRPLWQVLWKMINVKINLKDLSASKVTPPKQTTDPSLWFLRIDDLEISDVTVYSPNMDAVKEHFPKGWKWIKNLPSVWKLGDYRQRELGSDGKHTGTMIAKEILFRHIITIQKDILTWWEANKADLKAWFESKKLQYQQDIKKLKAQYDENKAKLEAWSEEQKPKLKAKYEEQKAKLKAQYDENKAKLEAWNEKQKPKLKAKYEEQKAKLKAWYESKSNAIYTKYSQDSQAEEKETGEATILTDPDDPINGSEGTLLE